MRQSVRAIFVHDSRIIDNQNVFGISFLGRLCEIERPGDHLAAIEDHQLVVSDRVPGIDKRRQRRCSPETARGRSATSHIFQALIRLA